MVIAGGSVSVSHKGRVTRVEVLVVVRLEVVSDYSLIEVETKVVP